MDSKKLLRWLPAVLWTFTICWLSFSPLDKFVVPKFSGVDKIGHIGMYFILAWLIYFASITNNRVRFAVILGAIILALVTELVQHYLIKNRQGDILDFVANLIGIIIVYLWKRKSLKT